MRKPLSFHCFQEVLRKTATVSHFFSQPLTFIKGQIDLLLAQALTLKRRKKLGIIRNDGVGQSNVPARDDQGLAILV